MFPAGFREPGAVGGVRGVTVMRLLALLLALTLGADAHAEPSPAAPAAPADTSLLHPVCSFADLRRGDELVVRHNSYNCFAFSIFDLTFRRDDSLRVTVVLVRSGPAGAKYPRRLAILTVTDSTCRELDELMRFYRGEPRLPPSNGGTRLHMVQTHDGALVAREEFEKLPTVRRLGSYGFNALIDLAWRAAPPSAF